MTILITGASRGIGYEAARVLAKDTQQTILLTGRDGLVLDAAVTRLQSATGNRNLIPMTLNLASLDSIRTFAKDFQLRDVPPLRAILCNAGISLPTIGRRSLDGFEETFAVNHLGHFLLVSLLIDMLRPPARIVVVSSGVHDPAPAARGPMQPPRFVHAEWLAYPERDPELLKDDAQAGDQAYASSKLCNVLFTYELARQLEQSGRSTRERPITVNAYDPGLIAGTDLGRDARILTRMIWYAILPAMSRLLGFGRDAREAGADLAYLCTAPELSSVTGSYFSGRRMTKSSTESYDQGKANELWQTSIALTGLDHEARNPWAINGQTG